MLVSQIKFNDVVIVEINKYSNSFACTINKANFKPLLPEGRVFSSLPPFKTDKIISLKLATLSSLLWLKQNSKQPIEAFQVIDCL